MGHQVKPESRRTMSSVIARNVALGLAAAAIIACAAGGARPIAAQEPAPAAPPAPAGEVMTLDQCIKIALERSPTYGQAEERLYTSQGGVGVARSTLLPQLSLAGSVDRYGTTQTFFDSRLGGAVPSDDSYNAQLQLSQNVFDGFKNWNRLSAAKSRRKGAEAGLRDARLNTILQVKEGYLGVLRSQHLLKVANETLEASRHRQERVDALFEVGSVAKADVLQNKVQLAQDQLNAINARNLVEISRASLLNAMGYALDRPIEVAEMPVTAQSEIPALETLLPEAHKNNPGLADLHQETLASNEDLDVAKGDRFPSLDLNWLYDWNGYQLPRTGTEFTDRDASTAVLALRFNIFDGFGRRSSISMAKHIYEQTKKREEQATLDLALDVKRQHSSLLEAGERIRVADESVSSAEERVRLEEERYRLGAATLLELIEAQVDLTRARASQVESRYDYSLAWARLERALGRE